MFPCNLRAIALIFYDIFSQRPQGFEASSALLIAEIAPATLRVHLHVVSFSLRLQLRTISVTQFARRDPEESCRMRNGLRTHENVKPLIALDSSNAIYKSLG